MSGIYIPGMEMPENSDCLHCPCADLEYMDCNLMPGSGIGYKKRPDNCPLIPVPEHGDLIDRDALEKDIDEYIGGEESRSRFHHWVQVQDAVIPMDKGEEK